MMSKCWMRKLMSLAFRACQRGSLPSWLSGSLGRVRHFPRTVLRSLTVKSGLAILAAQDQSLGKVLFQEGLEAVGQLGAFVDDGAAMKDRLLDGAGLAVFGRPGFEFIVVSQEQFGQVASVLGVVFGAAGDEDLAELLEAEGIDGVETDPLIGFQEGDEVDGGLFQAESHAGLGVLLA